MIRLNTALLFYALTLKKIAYCLYIQNKWLSECQNIQFVRTRTFGRLSAHSPKPQGGLEPFYCQIQKNENTIEIHFGAGTPGQCA